MRQRRFWAWGVLMVTAVLLFALFTDAFPWLRGPAPDTSIWHWPYLLRPFSRWWAAIAAGAIFLSVLGWWLRQQQMVRWQTAVVLVLLFASSLALQWGLLYADNPQSKAELINRTLAVQTNGYFWTAANIDNINTTLKNYPREMTRFESDHARTHPPGLVLANWLTLKFMQKTPKLAQKIAQSVYPLRCTDLWLLDQPPATATGLGIWAMLPLILGATAVFPAYWFAKSLSRNLAAAKLAVLVTAIPALLIFAPLPDQIYGLFTLLIVTSFHQGWQQQKKGWLFTAGLLLSIATFLSVGNAALLILIGSYILLASFPRRASRNYIPRGAWNGNEGSEWLFGKIVLQIIPFGVGLISVWLLYWLGWGVPPWRIIQVGLSEHAALVASQRSYATWLLFNLLDVVIFLGFPVAVAFCGSLLMTIRKLNGKSLSQAQVWTISTAVLIILLNLSGSTRGEVGRIWLFFMPLMLISGGIWLAEWLPNWHIQMGWASLQIIWAITLGLSWQPMQATLVVAERPLFPSLPSHSIPINASFGSQIRLNQVALSQTPDALILTLEWETEGAVERPFTIFNHLIDAEGNLVAQADSWSVNGQWPPTCWQVGEQIVDQHQIDLPAGLSEGNYTLKTGLYDARDGIRLLTAAGNDHAVIGQITLVPISAPIDEE
ncbi:MAG: hypothetical protein GY805_00475 [Chloroflexi bacterium]|nr:hypothetical protein [Chloroflexota bacterium]